MQENWLSPWTKATIPPLLLQLSPQTLNLILSRQSFNHLSTKISPNVSFKPTPFFTSWSLWTSERLRVWKTCIVPKVYWDCLSRFPSSQLNWYHFSKFTGIFIYFWVLVLLIRQKHCSSKQQRHSTTKIFQRARSTKCWTHNQSIHNFFINYRVYSEGKRCPLSHAVSDSFSYIVIFVTVYFRNLISKMELCNSFMRNLQLSDTKEIPFVYFGIKSAFALHKIGNKDSFKDWQHLKLSSCSSPTRYTWNWKH